MNDILRLQVETRRDKSIALLDKPYILHSVVKELFISRRHIDGMVTACPNRWVVISRIYNSFRIYFGDVISDDFKGHGGCSCLVSCEVILQMVLICNVNTFYLLVVNLARGFLEALFLSISSLKSLIISYAVSQEYPSEAPKCRKMKTRRFTVSMSP